jgi:hypothetical protein
MGHGFHSYVGYVKLPEGIPTVDSGAQVWFVTHGHRAVLKLAGKVNGRGRLTFFTTKARVS